MRKQLSGRRQLLRWAAAAASSSLLTACGGSDASVGDGPGNAPQASPGAADDTAGEGQTVAPAGFAWRISIDQVLVLPPGTSTVLATGALAMTARVVPALPEGRTLSITGKGDLVVVASADAPPVDAIGPWSIEVSPVQ